MYIYIYQDLFQACALSWQKTIPSNGDICLIII